MKPQKENYVTLSAAFKFAGFCETGGEAKQMIQNGAAFLNGAVCTQRGKKIFNGDMIGNGEKSVKIEIE